MPRGLPDPGQARDGASGRKFDIQAQTPHKSPHRGQLRDRTTSRVRYSRSLDAWGISNAGYHDRCYRPTIWPKQAGSAANQPYQPDELSSIMCGQREARATYESWNEVADRRGAKQFHTVNDLTFQYLDYFHHACVPISLERWERINTCLKERRAD